MMRIPYILSLSLSMLMISCSGAQPDAPVAARIAFYNVENLFDTEDDPSTDDADFLPNGKLNWTTERYKIKLNNIAKVILAIGDGNGPELIGLCEVENRKVLEDLIEQTPLKEQSYAIAHYDSPDGRGIDVALLYKKTAFQVIASAPFVAPQITDSLRPTRNILYVKGVLGTQDTLGLFINHWPSRRSGIRDTEPRRIAMANCLKHLSDSIALSQPDLQQIAMGDFNDEPFDESLRQLAHALPDINSDGFVNMMTAQTFRDRGTHFHQKEKNLFDQILISGNLFQVKGFYTTANSAFVFQPEWIMYKNPQKNIYVPSRTYVGDRYTGGYSDHLPVVLNLYKISL